MLEIWQFSSEFGRISGWKRSFFVCNALLHLGIIRLSLFIMECIINIISLPWMFIKMLEIWQFSSEFGRISGWKRSFFVCNALLHLGIIRLSLFIMECIINIISLPWMFIKMYLTVIILWKYLYVILVWNIFLIFHQFFHDFHSKLLILEKYFPPCLYCVSLKNCYQNSTKKFLKVGFDVANFSFSEKLRICRFPEC